MAKKRTNRPAKFWKEHVKKQRESGLHHAEYCRRHGIQDHQLRYWKSKIDKDSRAEKSEFIDIGVSARPLSFTIRLADGFEVEFPQEPSPDWMAKFILKLRDQNALSQ